MDGTIFSYRTETLSSLETEHHAKLLNELAEDHWEFFEAVYKPPSRYSDGKFYLYFRRKIKV